MLICLFFFLYLLKDNFDNFTLKQSKTQLIVLPYNDPVKV